VEVRRWLFTEAGKGLCTGCGGACSLRLEVGLVGMGEVVHATVVKW
jgi:hypothetical protein